MKIDHVMLRTINLEESIEFYTKIFGMIVLSRDNRMNQPENKYDSAFVGFANGDFKIELVYNAGKDFDDSYFPGSVFGHLGIYVGDIEMISEKAKSRGYKMEKIVNHNHGSKAYKIATIVSPEKIELALVQKVSK